MSLYQKNALLVRELDITTIAKPTDYLLIESLSASEKITVGDFVNSYSTVYYQFYLDNNGDLQEAIFSAGQPLSSTDLGRVKFVWKQSFNPSVQYVKDDVVYYGGSAFIALSTVTGVTPVSGGQYWDLFVLGYTPGNTVLATPTVSSLRALDTSVITDNSPVYVLGYYVANDRGGGVFRWNSTSVTTDDGGSIIRPTAVSSGSPGRWVRSLGGERPNVKMWGAKGDNNTDDTIAIRNAIAAMQFGWATELIFTTGNYLVSDTLIVPSNIKIAGEGNANNTLIGMIQNSNKNIITLTNPITAAAFSYIPVNTGFIIENLTLYYQHYDIITSANQNNTCLTVNNLNGGLTIRNITTYGGGYGIQCIGSSPGVLYFENISINQTYLAGIKIAPLSSQTVELGSIKIDGLYSTNNSVSASSPVLFLQNEASNIQVTNFSLSGTYSTGAILWDVPQLSAVKLTPFFKISNGTFVGDISQTSDLLVLTSTQLTTDVPTINIEGVSFSNCRNLITDSITPYNISSQVVAGIDQGTPIYYNVKNSNDPSTRKTQIAVKKSDNVVTQFTPVSAGWYTIFTGVSGNIGANISIASINDFVSFDAVFNSLNQTQFFKVDCFDSYNPNVTKARMLSINGTAYLDVYIVGTGTPLTFTYKSNGKDLSKQDGFCIPTLTTNTIPQSSYNGYEEIGFDQGLVASNNSHLKLGTSHIWVEGGKNVRHYNEGVNVTIFGGLSTLTTFIPAAARGNSDPTGKIQSITVTNPGTGYTSTPSVSAQNSHSPYATISAVLSAIITNGSVTQVKILSGGSGYSHTVNIYFSGGSVQQQSPYTAQAVAYIQDGQIARVNIIDPGYGYQTTPVVFVSPVEDNNGTGAVLQATLSGNSLGSITVLSGGSGYGAPPLLTSGRRFLTDVDFAPHQGVSIRNFRQINYQTINLTVPQSNSYIITGSSFLNNLYPGDRWMLGSNVVEIAQVLDDSNALLLSAYPTQVTNGLFTKVSWEVFPALNGYRYMIAGARFYLSNNNTYSLPIFTAGTNNQLVFSVSTKTNPITNSNILMHFGYQNWEDNNSDDITKNATNLMIGNTTVDPFGDSNNGLFSIQGGANNIPTGGIGIGSLLPNNVGVCINSINATSLNYYLIQSGKPCIMEVWGMRYPNNSTY